MSINVDSGACADAELSVAADGGTEGNEGRWYALVSSRSGALLSCKEPPSSSRTFFFFTPAYNLPFDLNGDLAA